MNTTIFQKFVLFSCALHLPPDKLLESMRDHGVKLKNPVFGKELKRSPMTSKHNQDIEELLLEAHRRGVEQAIDLSARTGVPLVVEENGKIKRIKPPYKYVRVPIQSNEVKTKSRKDLTK